MSEPLATGEFFFVRGKQTSYATLVYGCPCGCGVKRSLPVREGQKEVYCWKWNGDEALPTLQPSIKITDGCKWHGWLREGRWERAG